MVRDNRRCSTYLFGAICPARGIGASKRASNMYAAAYWPRIRVQDPESGSRWIPPTGHVMGVMARTDQQRGVWKAPAGNDARVSGALDVKYHISDATHTSLVKDGSVNAVRFVSGQGIVVDSARTMSTNPWTGFNELRTGPISQASAVQRAGRAGRHPAPGFDHRAVHNRRPHAEDRKSVV